MQKLTIAGYYSFIEVKHCGTCRKQQELKNSHSVPEYIKDSQSTVMVDRMGRSNLARKLSRFDHARMTTRMRSVFSSCITSWSAFLSSLCVL